MLNHYVFRNLLFTALISLVGCSSSGGSADGTKELATVKGSVKVKGKPMSGGTLHFNAINPNRTVAAHDAEIKPDGTFTVQAVVGQNIVTVSPPRKSRADAKNRDFFGMEYIEKTVIVKADEENAVDLDLTP